MIQTLKCSVAFASSGFTLESEFQGKTGITAVVGPNGIGKTFATIELTRYLLFGKKALRGTAVGYKNLKADGTFMIRGGRYFIHRYPDHESLTNEEGTVLAVGAKAVTEKVEELMGYGLDVFDVCNASVQGQTHLFSQKTAAERKRMIDRVVGLASNEVVEKACRAEATALKREADAMTRLLVVPVAPTAPSTTKLSFEIEQQITTEREKRKRLDMAERTLVSVSRPQKPDVPQPDEGKLAELETLQDEYRDVAYQRAGLLKIVSVDAPLYGYSDEQLDAAEERRRYLAYLDKLGPKPTLTQEEVDRVMQEWALADAHEISEAVTCPNCNHMFRPTGEAPLMPLYSRQYLGAEQRRLARWEGVDETVPEGLDLTAAEVTYGREANKAYKAHQEAQDALAALPALTDHKVAIDALRASGGLWAAYLNDQLRYERAIEQNAEVDRQIEQIGEVMSLTELDALGEELNAARIFEAQWAAWDAQKMAFDKLSAEIAEKSELADEYRKGGEALADARATIKAFLAPALSRVASKLLYDMTNGQLQSVHIDDDMNVVVGAQTLETLSGGGLTAANIALRVALGQVLVGDAFPVFLGDEIDADVDDIRREAVIESLVGLKADISQIILVTHRDLGVADHVYDLSNR